jgi:hypothetical protein
MADKLNALARAPVNALSSLYDLYQRRVGQPFQQAVRGGVRGYFGLPLMSDADPTGREAYRQGEALGYTPGVGMPAGAVRVAAEGVQALPAVAGEIGRVIAGMPSGAGAAQAEDFARYQRSILPTDVSPKLNASAVKTETPEFKQWFSGSKVVDESGSPLVGYHYTTGNINVFEPSDIGTHVGTTIGQAESRAKAHGGEGGNVMPLYVSIKNPLRLSDSPSWADPTWYVTESGVAKFLPKSLIDEAKSLKDVYKKNQALERSIGRPGFADQANRSAAMEVNKKVREELQKQGYDGIVYANTHDGATLAEKMQAKDSYIAFQPEQIKSAIGNRGTYDVRTPNIAR